MTDNSTALQLATDLFESATAAHAESKKDVTAKAVQLLAVGTREEFPDAVTLHLWDSDQGDYLDIHKVVLRDGTEVDGSEVDSRWDALTDNLWHVPSWLYPQDDAIPGFTWEKDKRDNTIDAHINIQEALQ